VDNFELPEEQHKKRIEEILKTVPYEYRSWLEEKLKYSNEKNLRKRLRELLDNFAELLYSFIPDKESFINKKFTKHINIKTIKILKKYCLYGKYSLKYFTSLLTRVRSHGKVLVKILLRYKI